MEAVAASLARRIGDAAVRAERSTSEPYLRRAGALREALTQIVDDSAKLDVAVRDARYGSALAQNTSWERGRIRAIAADGLRELGGARHRMPAAAQRFVEESYRPTAQNRPAAMATYAATVANQVRRAEPEVGTRLAGELEALAGMKHVDSSRFDEIAVDLRDYIAASGTDAPPLRELVKGVPTPAAGGWYPEELATDLMRHHGRDAVAMRGSGREAIIARLGNDVVESPFANARAHALSQSPALRSMDGGLPAAAGRDAEHLAYELKRSGTGGLKMEGRFALNDGGVWRANQNRARDGVVSLRVGFEHQTSQSALKRLSRLVHTSGAGLAPAEISEIHALLHLGRGRAPIALTPEVKQAASRLPFSSHVKEPGSSTRELDRALAELRRHVPEPR